MSIVIGETLLALSNVSMNYVNGTEKQVKENAKFSDQLGTTEVNNIVKEIYNKFGINVGVSNSRFECFIPGDVFHRMNTDSALKNKVYAMLADYSSSCLLYTSFSKVARLVDECGSAVILKNNVPRYLVIDFSKADKDFTASDEDVLSISKQLMEQNKEAYEVLAK